MEQLKAFARRANLEREECLEKEKASARERGTGGGTGTGAGAGGVSSVTEEGEGCRDPWGTVRDSEVCSAVADGNDCVASVVLALGG